MAFLIRFHNPDFQITSILLSGADWPSYPFSARFGVPAAIPSQAVVARCLVRHMRGYHPQLLHLPKAENLIPYNNLKTQTGLPAKYKMKLKNNNTIRAS
jgi:hypothetical protein